MQKRAVHIEQSIQRQSRVSLICWHRQPGISIQLQRNEVAHLRHRQCIIGVDLFKQPLPRLEETLDFGKRSGMRVAPTRVVLVPHSDLDMERSKRIALIVNLLGHARKQSWRVVVSGLWH